MAGRALPAAAPPRPISLDNLLARNAPAPRREHVVSTLNDAFPHVPRHVPSPKAQPDKPTALVLNVNVLTCACGTIHRVPAAYALARYEVNAHSFRYSRADVDADTAALPREVREHHLRIPFCEACFNA